MMPFDKARTITALIIFLLVVLAALYLGYRGWHIARRETFRKQASAILWLVGLWILLLWVMRDVWYYGIFGTAFDLRVWLLGVAVYLLYRRLGRTKEGELVTRSPQNEQ
jgi:hypothetical protein